MPSGKATRKATSATRATTRTMSSRCRRTGGSSKAQGSSRASPSRGSCTGSIRLGPGSGPGGLFARVLPAGVLPEEEPFQAQLLDVHRMEGFVRLGLFAVDAQVDGVGGDPVDVIAGRPHRVPGLLRLVDHAVKDVLLGEGGNIQNLAHLLAVAGHQ